MATPTYISTESVASGANATIPSNCNLAVAYVGGTPTLNGVAMESAGNSWHFMRNPPKGTVAHAGGNTSRFLYFVNGGRKQGNNGGSSATGRVDVVVTADVSCVIVAWCTGTVGPTGVNVPIATSCVMVVGTTVGYQYVLAANPTCRGYDNGTDGNVNCGFASFQYESPSGDSMVVAGPEGVAL